ncbi:MAG: glycerate kinase [Acidobacteriota bacterium]
MKDVLKALFLKTLSRISLDQVLPRRITCRNRVLCVGGERIDLDAFDQIIQVALGKAAFKMTEIVTALLRPHSVSGVMAGPAASKVRPLPGFLSLQGGHPYPDTGSLESGRAVIEALENVTEKDLVIFLLSGGGSSICEKPIFPELTLGDVQDFYQLLVTCGASIVDVNFVRKHFSAVKGGRLAELAHPARQVTLYVSDAPPGNPSNVASGPTMPDESTVRDCYRIVDKLQLADRLPEAIGRIFEEKRIPETPKADSRVFENSSWHCLLTPEEAMEILAEETRTRGFVVETDFFVADDWPLERATGHLLGRLEQLCAKHAGRRVAVVNAGEFSCPVTGPGVGGRNQAFVLGCVSLIGGRNVAVLSAGTDGVDGVSPAAGAVADGNSLRRARELGMDPDDYSRRSDSFRFFSALNDTIMTGPTGNNVRDLRILCGWEEERT